MENDLGKQCTKCLKKKEPVAFRKWRKACIECELLQNRTYYSENIDRVRKRNAIWHKDYHKKNTKKLSEYNKTRRKLKPELFRNQKLYYAYGITLSDYNDMLIKQKDSCASCGKHKSNFRRGLNVDHDHKTKKVRGLLCQNCNTSLGLLNEDVDVILRLANYIKMHQN